MFYIDPMGLDSLITTFTELEIFIKSIHDFYTGFSALFDLLFYIFPPEFLVFLLIGTFFLIMINQVSPLTPVMNYVMAYGITAFAWNLIASYAGMSRTGKSLQALLVIYLPVIAITALNKIYSVIARGIKLKKFAKSGLDESIMQFHGKYHEIQGLLHRGFSGDYEKQRLKELLAEMEQIQENMKKKVNSL